MGVKESKKGDSLVLDLSGRLDTSNYGELEKNLLDVIERGEKNIVIDCSELHYISSSGLRVFLMALKKISAAGGRFRLCSLQDNIREIFEIAGFNTIFSIFGTVDEATK
ncbi:MAG: STAS domain-containing protein [Bacteroidota bacterium]